MTEDDTKYLVGIGIGCRVGIETRRILYDQTRYDARALVRTKTMDPVANMVNQVWNQIADQIKEDLRE